MKTKRLMIRPHTAADFEDYFGYIMGSALQRDLGLREVADRQSAWATFQWLMDNREFLALVYRATGTVIGRFCPCCPPGRSRKSWAFG